ncbi:MAG: MotA/TolQ/ExbB proton channel family protein [Gammaproteobacteria bacterium]|nr:MotA/TolQ/ExbB proton channel family protein [Gammaproteobacteria bacterium]
MAYALPSTTAPGQEAAAASGAESGARHFDGQASAEQSVARFYAALKSRFGDPYRYVLLMRFVLLNLLGFGLLAAAWVQGLVQRAFTADQTHLCVVIALVFLAGLVLCARKVLQTSRELNSVRCYEADASSPAAKYLAPMHGMDADARANLAGALRMKIAHRTAVVRHIANSLVLLGLIGTVLGFIIALSGVDPERASDVNAITPMVSTLIQGMSTALYTTLVGAVLNVWLMANHQVLAGGTVKLMTALVELAEANARN